MPHINAAEASGSMGDPDYSEFEYEVLKLESKVGGNGGKGRATTFHRWDPLQAQGGLNNNEVAELVSHRILLNIDEESADGSQNSPTFAEITGKFGANLANGDILNAGDNNVEAGEADISLSDNFQDTLGVVESDNRVFEILQAVGGFGFDNANGAGGNYSGETKIYGRNWREATGRGPVLDATDDLVVNHRALVEDGDVPMNTSIQLHLVYDTAEIDDAGREFSVPR